MDVANTSILAGARLPDKALKSAKGDGWLEAIHSEDRAQIRAELTLAAQSERPFQIAARLKLADGAVRFALAVGAPRRDERGAFFGYSGSILDRDERIMAQLEPAKTPQNFGAITGALVAGHDIAARKEAEQSVRAWHFRAIFNQQYQYTALLTPDGRILEISASVTRGTGFEIEEIIGSSFLDGPWWRDLPETRARVQGQFDEALSRRVPSHGEAAYHGRDGELRHALNTVTALRDERGEVEFLLAEGIDITERLQAEEKLRESKALLQAVLDASPDPIFLKDRESRWVLANPAACDDVGKAAEACIGKTDEQLLSDPAQGRALMANDRRIISSGQPETVEEILETSLGTRIFITKKAPFRDEAGNIVGIIGTARDITERKRAEEKLRESEALLKAVLDNSPDAIFLKDREGRLLLANPATLAAIGKAPEFCIGKTDAEFLLDPDDSRAIMADDCRVMESGQTGSFEETVLTPNGIRCFLNSKTPFRDAAGNIIGLIGVARDITKQKKAEATLRESERRYRSLVHAASAVTWSCPPSGMHVEPLTEWIAFTGQTAEEVLGDGWTKALHPDDHAAVATAWREALAQGVPFVSEHRIRRHDGQWRWMNVQAAPIRDADGEIVEWFGMNIDVTERREAEEKLRKSEETLINAQRFARAGVWDVDLVEDRVEWSEPLYELYGLPRSVEPSKANWIEGIHPDDRLKAEAESARALAARDGLRVEFRIIRDGEIRWLRSEGRVICDSANRPVRITGFAWDVTERKRAEEALRDSEERFRVSFASASIGFAMNGPDYQFLEANPAYCALTGYTLEELRIKGSELIHPDDQPANMALVENMLAGEIPGFVIENRYIRKDGGNIWVRKSVSLIRDADGRPRWIVTLVEDVTERKFTEAALRDSELRYRSLIEAASAITWRCPSSGLFIEPQPEWMAFTGQTEAESLRDGWTHAVHPDDLDSVMSKWRAAVERGEPYGDEYRLRRHDRQWRWAHMEAAPIRDASGAILEWFGMGLDITERKEAELALRESRQQLAMALEAGQLGFWDWDVPSGRTQFGGVWAAMLGYDLSTIEPHYRAWEALIHPDDRKAVTGTLMDHIEGRTDFYECEYRLRHRNGSWRWILGRGQVVERNAEGRPLRAIGTHADVTARHEAEAAVAEADRRKDEFLATLAHELRNPLAPIRNAVHVLQLKYGSEHSEASLLDMVQRQVDHLVRLVDELLEISRISRGKIELSKEHVALSKVLRHALETCEPLIDMKSHSVKVSCEDEQLWIYGDVVRLAQIASNIISNAAKYTPPGGRIEVVAARRDHEVALSVRDNGVGISADMMPRIFDLFTQTQGQIRLSEGGLGIGLALVRKLVELHGGRVEAHSAGVGCGSEFVVWLPLGEGPPAVAPSVEKSPTAAGMIARALVIDDDRDVADSFALLLESLGASVRKAYDGPAGVALVGAFDPDMIFVDLGMPVVDGYETARLIRRNSDGRRFTLVALTGWGQEDDRRRALEAGFDLHLTKPASIDAIKALLQPLSA